jgi:hypothetical protein
VKHCTKCDRWKPPAEFHLDKGKPDGLHNWCKTCRGYQTSTVTERRVCAFPGCKTILSRFNTGKKCSVHEGPDARTMRTSYTTTVAQEVEILKGKAEPPKTLEPRVKTRRPAKPTRIIPKDIPETVAAAATSDSVPSSEVAKREPTPWHVTRHKGLLRCPIIGCDAYFFSEHGFVAHGLIKHELSIFVISP